MADEDIKQESQAEATQESVEASNQAKYEEFEKQFGKPLDKMTAKELREAALKIGNIVGVHTMDKPELVEAIKNVKGIVEVAGQKKNARAIRRIKSEILVLRGKREEAREAGDKKRVDILRRKIGRLKKETRSLAQAS